MRTLLVILLLFVCNVSIAGKPDTSGLSQAVEGLNQALLQKDSLRLRRLLHKKLQYGHSNGWIETRQEVINDLFNGKLLYRGIDPGEYGVTEENGTACVRSRTEIDVLLNGVQVQMTLHVLQIWIREKKGWVLLSRQSTKIN